MEPIQGLCLAMLEGDSISLNQIGQVIGRRKFAALRSNIPGMGLNHLAHASLWIRRNFVGRFRFSVMRLPLDERFLSSATGDEINFQPSLPAFFAESVRDQLFVSSAFVNA